MTDHLQEIDELSRHCIEDAIELLPSFNECRTNRETEQKIQDLLINLRAIQHELGYFRAEQRDNKREARS